MATITNAAKRIIRTLHEMYPDGDGRHFRHDRTGYGQWWAYTGLHDYVGIDGDGNVVATWPKEDEWAGRRPDDATVALAPWGRPHLESVEDRVRAVRYAEGRDVDDLEALLDEDYRYRLGQMRDAGAPARRIAETYLEGVMAARRARIVAHGDSAVETLVAATEARRDAEGALDRQHKAIRAALDAGLGVARIVAITGLSRGRVYQIRDRRR